ncbi:hypothetical protein QBC45DRAFT_392948 [Copromyces sp. CBS 386.78]|nr:hypothetical protein QBC45DRAFT_392948 [Copromyces sp. CBS 386.78]
MNSTSQFPSQFEPSHPLNLITIPELNADLSNFTQWSHAVGFHLRYHKLMDYVRDDMHDEMIEPTTEEAERENQEMRSLHAYSLIASKIWNVAPEFERVMGKNLFLNEQRDFHFDPRQLWEDIHLFVYLYQVPGQRA